MGEERDSLSASCSFTDGMDLDTPAELISPEVNQTSLNNTSTDVFSLLISQVQQCHTQQLTELQQKINLLKRKCQKLEGLVKGRGEIALKYRQTCVRLREENRGLKRMIRDQTRPHGSSPPRVPKGSRVSQSDKDMSPPNVEESGRGAMDTALEDSKRSRLTRKKGRKKVRYAETVTSPDETTASQRLRRLKASIEEKLLVPETMDPDLVCMDDVCGTDRKYPLRESSSQSSPEDDMTQSSNGRPTHVVRSDDQSLDTKERWQPKPNLPNSVEDNPDVEQVELEEDAVPDRKYLPQETSTPVYSASRTRHSSRMADLSPVILQELDDTSDERTNGIPENTEMSPTFARQDRVPVGHHTSPSAARSPQDRFNGTSESEASHLMFQQRDSLISVGWTDSPSGNKTASSFHSPTCNPLDLKRKISPLERRSKLARVSERNQSGSRTGVKRGRVSFFDERLVKDHVKLHQSTLSQHFPQAADTTGGPMFKVPAVPYKVDKSGSDSIKESGSPCMREKPAEEMVDMSPSGKVKRQRLLKDESLNGSVDPVIDLDDYDEDRHSAVTSPADAPGEAERVPGKNVTVTGKAKDPGGIVTPGKAKVPGDWEELSTDRSDVMFEESTDNEPDQDYVQGGLILARNGTSPEGIANFDRVPTKDDRPDYKHREVVRKHDDRDKLKGFDCKQCAEYYGGMALTDTQKEDRMKACSRHRGRYTPPSTPEHYWSIDFPDTPTCVKRGYIQEDTNDKVDEQVMPRRRNKLKQLFKK